MANLPSPNIKEWLVDTRPLWPEAKKTQHLEIYASHPLSLLPPATKSSVLRYVHVKDAKLSLLSHLVKQYAISSLLHLPWSESTPAKDGRTGKPVFPGIAFNVSHQAGIVALVAVAGYDSAVDTGIDVVSTTERRDRDRAALLGNDGDGFRPDKFGAFLNTYADVFGAYELDDERDVLMGDEVVASLRMMNSGRLDEADMRLRAFYSLWCMREAYLKMTGEGLVAPWVKKLVFVEGWKAPAPTACHDDFEMHSLPKADQDTTTSAAEETGDSTAGGGGKANAVDNTLLLNPAIKLRGRPVTGVNMALRSLGRGIIISTAVRTPGREEDGVAWLVGQYEMLDLDRILQHADARS